MGRGYGALLETVEPFPLVSGFMFNFPPGKPEGCDAAIALGVSARSRGGGQPSLLDDCLRELYRRMDRTRYRIMAAGGIFSAEDAYKKIRLGASLVQLMTGLIYEGPSLVTGICRGLGRLLKRRRVQECHRGGRHGCS